ncbi:MAG: 30S ribosomal protein S1 [Bacteroidetes bacterium]|nr:30S ribosomal protein S1 [Bacteroidota bacterium]
MSDEIQNTETPETAETETIEAVETETAETPEVAEAETIEEAAPEAPETEAQEEAASEAAPEPEVPATGETAEETPEAATEDAPAVGEATELEALMVEASAEEAPPTEEPAADTAAPSLTSIDDIGSLRQEGQLGFTGEIVGRVVTLAELEQIEREMAGETDIPSASDEELLELYESSMTAVTEGEIVTGRVVSMTEKEVVLDIGFKSDGVVAKNEFDHELELGEEVEVYLEHLEDRRGQLMLSKLMAVDFIRWRTIEDAHENGTVVEGEIIRRIKGGMIVNLLGAEAFLPGSQIDVRPVRDFDAYLGKVMEFKVVKTNPTNGNVVISHKALIEKDLLAQRQKILETLEVGQVLEGQVKNIVNFGVFIDLGGVDGLLHITDLSWGRVGHPSEIVELDEKLNVVVLDYDKERQRISLGYKQLQGHPWDNIKDNYAEGQDVEGRVVSITDYGAFVELEKGIEGLVHISEMSWTEHVKHPTQKVQLGQMVMVKLLRIDEEAKKISLGMKQLEPDPWEGILDRFPIGTVTKGTVRNLTTFGAFVEIEAGIDGLVHVSDMSWTRRVKHPSEMVKKGQELDVVVLDIDVAQRRISLGHKQVSTDPWAEYESTFPEGSSTNAKVSDINDGGVVVELPDGDAEGFVPASHLSRSGSPADAYEVGDELELTVLRIDKDDRVIVLSETAKADAADRSARSAERSEKAKARREERRSVKKFGRQSSGPATLGEISGLAALKEQMEEAEASTEAAPEVEEPAAEAAEAPEVEANGKSVAEEAAAEVVEVSEEEVEAEAEGEKSVEEAEVVEEMEEASEAEEAVADTGTEAQEAEDAEETEGAPEAEEPVEEAEETEEEASDDKPAEEEKS